MSFLFPWISLLRVRQWVKNLLIFLPVFTSLRWHEAEVWFTSIKVFIAFCLLSSAVYVVNDLFDIVHDRQHPKKRHRPVASGVITKQSAFLGVAVLLISFALVAATLPAIFLLVAGIYVLLNLLYSFHLKRDLSLDLIVLAGFYSLRVWAGAATSDIPLSHWLLSFTTFLFLGLATMKRYSELILIEHDQGKVSGRAYAKGDETFLLIWGIGASLLSVLVLLLFVSSPEAISRYRAPALLWLLAPILLVWETRIWLLAVRGMVPDDPVAFTLRDLRSYFLLAVAVVVVVLSHHGF